MNYATCVDDDGHAYISENIQIESNSVCMQYYRPSRYITMLEDTYSQSCRIQIPQLFYTYRTIIGMAR